MKCAHRGSETILANTRVPIVTSSDDEGAMVAGSREHSRWCTIFAREVNIGGCWCTCMTQGFFQFTAKSTVSNHFHTSRGDVGCSPGDTSAVDSHEALLFLHANALPLRIDVPSHCTHLPMPIQHFG